MSSSELRTDDEELLEPSRGLDVALMQQSLQRIADVEAEDLELALASHRAEHETNQSFAPTKRFHSHLARKVCDIVCNRYQPSQSKDFSRSCGTKFLPGRMMYIFDLNVIGGAELPQTLRRSEDDCESAATFIHLSFGPAVRSSVAMAVERIRTGGTRKKARPSKFEREISEDASVTVASAKAIQLDDRFDMFAESGDDEDAVAPSKANLISSKKSVYSLSGKTTTSYFAEDVSVQGRMKVLPTSEDIMKTSVMPADVGSPPSHQTVLSRLVQEDDGYSECYPSTFQSEFGVAFRPADGVGTANGKKGSHARSHKHEKRKLDSQLRKVEDVSSRLVHCV